MFNYNTFKDEPVKQTKGKKEGTKKVAVMEESEDEDDLDDDSDEEEMVHIFIKLYFIALHLTLRVDQEGGRGIISFRFTFQIT